MAANTITSSVAGFSGGMSRVGNLFRDYLGTSVHREGMEMAKFGLGFGKYGKGMGRALGLASTAYGVYEGYRTGGARGAAVGAVRSVAENYLFGAALKAAGNVGTVAGTAVAFGAFAGMAGHMAYTGNMPWETGGSINALLRPLVYRHMRRQEQLEMGRPIVDQFGTVATMRQRSLMAIQNSKINGRSALGNEAFYTYRSYYR